MACKRMFYRELRRRQAATRHKAKRAQLKEVANNRGWTYSYEEVLEAQKKLQELPRDANRIRERKRCFVCGRPRGFVGKFGLCRIHLRELAMQGFIPGLRLSSW